jgi:hypothetical protein
MCSAGQLGPISDVVQLICHARTRTATFYATVSPCLLQPLLLRCTPLHWPYGCVYFSEDYRQAQAAGSADTARTPLINLLFIVGCGAS